MIVSCWLSFAACGGEGAEREGAETPAASASPVEDAAPVKAPSPTDGDAFLRALAPLPPPAGESKEAGLRLRYRVRGPAGSSGELIVELAAGGLRREAWTLKLPAMGGAPERELRSLRVQTRSQVWNAVGDGAGEVYDNPLAEIAEAYEARDEAKREVLIRTLRDWQAALVNARREQPGEREEIEGTSCLRMTMAGQALCIWEETGLPLRHQGDAFELEVESIESIGSMPADIFELPGRAAKAKKVDPPQAWSTTGEAWLEALERGEPTALAAVLTPGLRMPVAAELGQADSAG